MIEKGKRQGPTLLLMLHAESLGMWPGKACQSEMQARSHRHIQQYILHWNLWYIKSIKRKDIDSLWESLVAVRMFGDMTHLLDFLLPSHFLGF